MVAGLVYKGVDFLIMLTMKERFEKYKEFLEIKATERQEKAPTGICFANEEELNLSVFRAIKNLTSSSRSLSLNGIETYFDNYYVYSL